MNRFKVKDAQSKSVGNTFGSILFVIVSYTVLIVLLSSCSSDLSIQREVQQVQEEGVISTNYSIVFIIHGDSEYLFHDTDGNEYKADEDVLAQAKKVAQQNSQAEVFIFHQKPRWHFLFLSPFRDGEFYYYRNGQLIANESYWRDQEQSQFEPEVELYRRSRLENKREMTNVFLYFGHQIPEFGGVGYDESYPDRSFTVHDFAAGLKAFTSDSARFDLMILSTCFGGTPFTINALGSYGRTIIASPENLHLSYFNLHLLENLDLGLHDGNMSAFAKIFARQAFDRLTEYVQTSVSIGVYDMVQTREYLYSVREIYENTLTDLNRETKDSMLSLERCDCADLSGYNLPTINKGVDIFYRAASFGRSKNKQNHSGWECWKEIGSPDKTPNNSGTIKK
ncbi:MAG: hypothetical protein V1720_06575 [bacterium]